MLTGTQIAIIVIVIVVLVIIGFVIFYYARDGATTGMAPNTLVTYKQSTSHREIPEANRINLFVEYYLPKDPKRQKEIDFTLRTNLSQETLDQVFVIVHTREEEKAARALNTRQVVTPVSVKGKEVEVSGDEDLVGSPRSLASSADRIRVRKRDRGTHSDDGLRRRRSRGTGGKRIPGGKTVTFLRIKNSRPTYGEIYQLIEKHTGHDDINIFCNSDIAFDSTIALVRRLNPQEAVALTRWNAENYLLPLRGRLENDQKWTQDTWIIRGPPRPPLLKVPFGTGLLRCDNCIAYVLSEEAGYKVFNPCHTIKSYHIHKSGIRNYTPVNVGKIHPSEYSKHGIVEGKGAYVLASIWI